MRAVLTGDGQVLLFENMETLCRYIEWQDVARGGFRAFLEDGTEFTLFVDQGAYIKGAFDKNPKWIGDFKYTSSEKSNNVDRNFLKNAILDYILLPDADSCDLKEASLEHLVNIFEQKRGFTR